MKEYNKEFWDKIKINPVTKHNEDIVEDDRDRFKSFSVEELTRVGVLIAHINRQFDESKKYKKYSPYDNGSTEAFTDVLDYIKIIWGVDK